MGELEEHFEKFVGSAAVHYANMVRRFGALHGWAETLQALSSEGPPDPRRCAGEEVDMWSRLADRIPLEPDEVRKSLIAEVGEDHVNAEIQKHFKIVL